MGGYATLKEFKEYLDLAQPPSVRWMKRALPVLESLLGDFDRRGWADEGRRLLFSVFTDAEVHRVGVWLTGLRIAAGHETAARDLFLARVRSILVAAAPRISAPPPATLPPVPRAGVDSMTCDLTWTRAPRPPVPAPL